MKKTFIIGTKLPERAYEHTQVLFCQTDGEQPIEEGKWIECDEKEMKKIDILEQLYVIGTDKYFGWL